jgi:hypothetical protein
VNGGLGNTRLLEVIPALVRSKQTVISPNFKILVAASYESLKNKPILRLLEWRLLDHTI